MNDFLFESYWVSDHSCGSTGDLIFTFMDPWRTTSQDKSMYFLVLFVQGFALILCFWISVLPVLYCQMCRRESAVKSTFCLPRFRTRRLGDKVTRRQGFELILCFWISVLSVLYCQMCRGESIVKSTFCLPRFRTRGGKKTVVSCDSKENNPLYKYSFWEKSTE